MAVPRGSAAVGMAALVAAGLLLVGAFVAVRALRSEPERSSQSVSLDDRSYEVGECLTWDQGSRGPTSTRAETVPCGEEHLREVVGLVELDDVRGGFPSEARWDRLKERCDPLVERYLGRHVNSYLHPIIRATIKPSPGTWADGDRELVCELGLRQVDLAAKRERLRPPLRGRFADLEWVSPFAAGDCIRWTDDLGTVPCEQAHQYEVTGIVDLRDAKTRAATVAEVERMADRSCETELDQHVRGSIPTGVSSTYIPIDQEDLDGGVRGLVCLGARFLGDDAVDLVGPLGS